MQKIAWKEQVSNSDAIKKKKHKRNTYIQNLEKTAEIAWIYNEEGRLVKLKLHGAYCEEDDS